MKEGECIFCEFAKGKMPCKKLYEDKDILAVLHPTPANLGHILVFPKKHYTILEQVPDFKIGKLFDVASKLSTATFESLNIGGTNIIVENGTAAGQVIPHFVIHVIPRMDNDGLNLMWQPKQLDQEELSTVELTLKEGCQNIGDFQTKEKKPIQMGKKKTKIIKDEDNYLIRSLTRIP